MKKAEKSWAQSACDIWPIVGGKAISEAAKITGITPAMFTRRGRYVDPPPAERLPTTRFAYWMGIRRWPSWMNTIATIAARAMKGIITTKIWSGLFHHFWMPLGRPETIDAKIISEMPLPMPRWVISSPSHITSTQPAVSVATITNTRPKVKSLTTSAPPPKLRKRNV